MRHCRLSNALGVGETEGFQADAGGEGSVQRRGRMDRVLPMMERESPTA